ncbi:MAG: hypothetical protein P4L42_13515 [Desulfocapsaceae bacterium]|nr:hypothetical protein [Desulfocapsaceae bacterium]
MSGRPCNDDVGGVDLTGQGGTADELEGTAAPDDNVADQSRTAGAAVQNRGAAIQVGVARPGSLAAEGERTIP